jgi:dipeptidyl aminopeptidase/acylaminoacyl peptidase
MNEYRTVLKETVDRFPAPELPLQRVLRRLDRRRRNQRIVAGAVGLAVFGGLVGASLIGLSPRPDRPASSPAPDTPGQSPLGLAIVGLDGTVQQDLGLPLDAWMPDLSSDGTQIVLLTGSTEVGFCGGCRSEEPPRDRITVIEVGKSSGRFIYLRDPLVREVAQPVWSPDGKQIAFVGVGREDGNRDIYVAEIHDRRGSPVTFASPRRLTVDPAVDEFPSWSPDGSTILYDNGGAEPLDDSGFSSTQEIWSIPAKGGTPERLTNNEAADFAPDVAADGTVAFWRDGDIWTMDQSGGTQERLKIVPSDAGFNPRWSPDGTMMALLRYDPSERAFFDRRPGRPSDLPLLEVVVVDLATGNVTTVGPRVAADFNPVSWTPDGSALLINRYDAGG